jgi:hypothetical protein
MKPRAALRHALRDFYANSWRLLILNATLGVLIVVTVLGTLAEPLAAPVFVAAVGPVVAALVHCTVTLVRTGDLSLADAAKGLRLHWLRGVELAAVGIAIVGLGILAFRFYGETSLWPLAFLTLYLLVLLAIYMLVLWTVAIAAPERSLAAVARESVALAMARPGQTLGLGFALLVINVAGIAAAVMPFLTLTVAYTFLVTARFLVPPEEEAV